MLTAQVKFAKSAHDAIVVERSLHEGFFAEFGVDDGMFAAPRASPTCAAYGDFLLATAYRPALLGRPWPPLLPCFQIYWEVGKHLPDLGREAQSLPALDRHLCRRGVRPLSVREMLALTDEAHAWRRHRLQAQMREIYLTACRYEWMFWDSAWRREAWPV